MLAKTIKEQSYQRLLFFIFLFLVSTKASASSPPLENLKQFASSREWTTSLYYTETNWRFKIQSRADSKEFFVSPDGKASPLAELQESLRLLLSQHEPLNDKSFACRFPARSNLLNQAFKLGLNFDRSNCSEYLEWRKRMPADRGSLVFSSFYLGNPSSAFGHILLRLGQAGAGSEAQRELLDQGVNFGASPWTDNPILYSVLGLSGSFPGTFIAIPYYYKVREYNDYESRDLWEYDLNLTPEEISKMVDLLWEQGQNSYDYYFLTENCGYYIVALIEAAAPRYDLTSRLRKWVIPSETLSQMVAAGVLKKPLLRKSIRHQFYEKIVALTPAQRDMVMSFFNNMNRAIQNDVTQITFPPEFKELTPLDQAKVLDAAIDFFDFKHSKKILLGDLPYVKVKRELLLQRSDLPIYDLAPKTEYAEDSPDKMHGSGRFEFGLGQEKRYDISSSKYLLGYRFSFHDPLDDQSGAPEGATIETFKTLLSIEKNKLNFLYLSLFDIRSSPRWNKWDQNISWKMRLSFEDTPYNACFNCQAAGVNVGAGLTTEFLDLDWSLMADTQLYYSNGFEDRPFEALIGPNLIIKSVPINKSWGFILEGKYFSNDINNLHDLYSISFDLRYHLQKNINIDLTYTQEKDRDNLKINLLLYHY